MTFNPNFPIPDSPPKAQVTQIRTNFSQYQTLFSENHAGLNDPNQGCHEGIIFTNQSSDPGVSGDYVVLYAKNATSQASTQPQLFAQIPAYLPTTLDPSKIGSLPMQITYNSVNTTGPVYQSFIMGGYILYFGMVSGAGSGSISILVTLSPAPTKILIAIARPNTIRPPSNFPVDADTQILTNKTFNINTNGTAGAFKISWMALAQA